MSLRPEAVVRIAQRSTQRDLHHIRILLFSRLGAVLTVGLWISGQMLASLALDGVGWLGITAEPVGTPEIVGALAVLTGAAIHGARAPSLRARARR